MADKNKKLFMNFPGSWYVDSTCINCDVCRQIAPDIFAEAEDYAYVKAQPDTKDKIQKSALALICCPTGSIGTDDQIQVRQQLHKLPIQIEDEVYYCGLNSRESDGGNSYFVRHPAGNWLIDSPRFHRHLVDKFHDWGGVDYIFITNQSNSADTNKYARKFQSQRIIHSGGMAVEDDCEVLVHGNEPQQITKHFLSIPMPGSSAGHQTLLYKSRYYFSGDYLWWDRYKRQLTMSEENFQDDEEPWLTSLEQLQNFVFEVLLPAHGERVKLSAEEMKDGLENLQQRQTEK